jgi:hypothetical protein
MVQLSNNQSHGSGNPMMENQEHMMSWHHQAAVGTSLADDSQVSSRVYQNMISARIIDMNVLTDEWGQVDPESSMGKLEERYSSICW